MRLVVCFILCFSFYLSNAQDTIYKRTGEIISSKVIEINTTSVSYKRFDLLDGPLFILNKNDVKKIKYQMGAVDSFKVVNDIKTVQLNNDNIVSSTMNAETIQRTRSSSTFIYKGKRIGDSRALLVVDLKNREWKNTELQNSINRARECKKNQYIVGFGGAGIGALGLISSTALLNTGTGSDAAFGAALLFNGIGIFIASQIVSGTFKSKRMKNTRKAVELYNQNL